MLFETIGLFRIRYKNHWWLVITMTVYECYDVKSRKILGGRFDRCEFGKKGQLHWHPSTMAPLCNDPTSSHFTNHTQLTQFSHETLNQKLVWLYIHSEQFKSKGLQQRALLSCRATFVTQPTLAQSQWRLQPCSHNISAIGRVNGGSVTSAGCN